MKDLDTSELAYRYSDFAKSSRRSHLHGAKEQTADFSKSAGVELFTPADLGSVFAYDLLIQQHELRELMPGISCADAEPDSLALRAALARYVVKDEGVLAQETARWLYTGGPIPQKLTVYYLPYDKRPQGKTLRGLRKRFYPGDVLTILGVRVMSPDYVRSDLELPQEILAPVIR